MFHIRLTSVLPAQALYPMKKKLMKENPDNSAPLKNTSGPILPSKFGYCRVAEDKRSVVYSYPKPTLTGTPQGKSIWYIKQVMERDQRRAIVLQFVVSTWGIEYLYRGSDGRSYVECGLRDVGKQITTRTLRWPCERGTPSCSWSEYRPSRRTSTCS